MKGKVPKSHDPYGEILAKMPRGPHAMPNGEMMMGSPKKKGPQKRGKKSTKY